MSSAQLICEFYLHRRKRMLEDIRMIEAELKRLSKQHGLHIDLKNGTVEVLCCELS